MHTFGETGAGVPAFLAKLWRLVEDPETNNLICWSKVSDFSSKQKKKQLLYMIYNSFNPLAQKISRV